MSAIFNIILVLLLYCYFGYPALLVVWSRLRSRKVSKEFQEPSISVLLSVWNEEDVIESKLKNLLSLDYPSEKVEILIGSDGSTDKTNEIIRMFGAERVYLLECEDRQGKMVTLNQLAKRAKNEVLVFTDARQAFAKNVLRELVANFADPQVGCVSGELVFSRKEGATAKGVNLYWNYEKFLRAHESRIHSMLGATGAIYAVRRELYVDIPEKVVLDDVFVPFQIIKQGYRAVFEGEAKAYDEVADSPREEYSRKARTLFGNYQIFFLLPEMFIPFKSPVALQLFSHKFLRVLAPFFMIALIILNWFIKNEFPFGIIFILQIVFYSMALVGGLARHQKYGILKIPSKVCYVPYVFCLLNFSALIGFLRFAILRQDVAWQKARKHNDEQVK